MKRSTTRRTEEAVLGRQHTKATAVTPSVCAQELLQTRCHPTPTHTWGDSAQNNIHPTQQGEHLFLEQTARFPAEHTEQAVWGSRPSPLTAKAQPLARRRLHSWLPYLLYKASRCSPPGACFLTLPYAETPSTAPTLAISRAHLVSIPTGPPVLP